MSYLIRNNAIIAHTTKNLKSGEIVEYAYDTTISSIDANRDCELVNAREAKISNAKKWDKISRFAITDLAIQINKNYSKIKDTTKEFIIKE
jgi:hypothetical protein